MSFSNHFCVFCVNSHFSCVCLHWVPWVPRLLFCFYFSLGFQNHLVLVDVCRRHSVFVLKFHICFIPTKTTIFKEIPQNVLAFRSRFGSESFLLFSLSSVVILGVPDIVSKEYIDLILFFFCVCVCVFRYILQNLERRGWRKSKFKDQ